MKNKSHIYNGSLMDIDYEMLISIILFIPIINILFIIISLIFFPVFIKNFLKYRKEQKENFW